jgi:cytochrome c
MQMLLKNCEENQMIKRFVLKSSVVLGVFAAGILTMPTAQAADEAAARELARANNCFKCHALDKDKDGPAWNAVAAMNKGKADASARLVKHLTTGEKAKFPDGHEEEHKVIKAKDEAQVKNLVDWILSLK